MMIDVILQYYLWIKALHIIAVISWMAGMLYLPRLYIYHCGTGKGSETSALFKVMERRLLRIIINPAMIASWVFGGLMLYANPDLLSHGWMHVKLTALILMQITHAAYARWRRHFANDGNRHSQKFYRYMNEVPTILMVIIIIMVIVRPY